MLMSQLKEEGGFKFSMYTCRCVKAVGLSSSDNLVGPLERQPAIELVTTHRW
jgi:hypothetical protein